MTDQDPGTGSGPLRARLGFPLHAVLVMIPIGALACSVLFDLVSRFGHKEYYARPAWWLLVFGVAGALVVGLLALRDLLRLERGTEAFRTGAWHVALTDVAVVLFMISALMRRELADDAIVPLRMVLVSAVGLAVLLVGAGAGARLTYHFGVGVDADDRRDDQKSV